VPEEQAKWINGAKRRVVAVRVARDRCCSAEPAPTQSLRSLWRPPRQRVLIRQHDSNAADARRIRLGIHPPPRPVPPKDVVLALRHSVRAEVYLLGLLSGQA